MPYSHKLGIIGYGNLSSALVEGWIRSKTFKAADLAIFTRTPEKASGIPYRIPVKRTLQKLLTSSEHLLLTVKPKDARALLKELSSVIADCRKSVPDKDFHKIKIISAIAGLKISEIQSSLKSAKVTRIMTNLSVADLCGATGIYSKDQNASAEVTKFFTKLGCIIPARKEVEIDAFTALAGSSPAFLSLAYEGLIKGGQEIGIGKSATKKIVDSLFTAMPHIIERNLLPGKKSTADSACSLLRKKIATPNGTTEAGLNSLGSDRIVSEFAKALIAANQRAKNLLA